MAVIMTVYHIQVFVTIKVSIKDAIPRGKVNKGEVYNAVVVRTRPPMTAIMSSATSGWRRKKSISVAPCTCPAANSSGVRTSSTCTPPSAISSCARTGVSSVTVDALSARVPVSAGAAVEPPPHPASTKAAAASSAADVRLRRRLNADLRGIVETYASTPAGWRRRPNSRMIDVDFGGGELDVGGDEIGAQLLAGAVEAGVGGQDCQLQPAVFFYFF